MSKKTEQFTHEELEAITNLVLFQEIHDDQAEEKQRKEQVVDRKQLRLEAQQRVRAARNQARKRKREEQKEEKRLKALRMQQEAENKKNNFVPKVEVLEQPQQPYSTLFDIKKEIKQEVCEPEEPQQGAPKIDERSFQEQMLEGQFTLEFCLKMLS